MSVFTREIVVRFEHCDPAGLMFYPRFFGLVNEIVEDWFASLAHSFKSLHLDKGMGVPTVKLDAEFLHPLSMGDTLTQTLRVTHLGRSSCQLRHEGCVDGKVMATFAQTIVYVDLATMKAQEWPPDLRAAMDRTREQT